MTLSDSVFNAYSRYYDLLYRDKDYVAEPALHPNENCVDVNYTIFARDLANGAVETMIETHPMRHFSLPELDLLAQMSGFAVVGTEEFLTDKRPSEETWGVCFILKKVA